MTSSQMTTGQVAAAFGVAPATVRKWVKRGRIEALREGFGNRRFDPAEIQKALASGVGPKFRRLPSGASADERFWIKVVGGSFEECWVWTGASGGNGYGQFHVELKRWTVAHRFAYLSLIGEIPEGLDLDHLCRNRACVNPWHLEPVTRQVNLVRGDGPSLASARGRAKTVCLRGHSLIDPSNVTVNAGRRHCLACRALRADSQRRKVAG